MTDCGRGRSVTTIATARRSTHCGTRTAAKSDIAVVTRDAIPQVTAQKGALDRLPTPPNPRRPTHKALACGDVVGFCEFSSEARARATGRPLRGWQNHCKQEVLVP